MSAMPSSQYICKHMTGPWVEINRIWKILGESRFAFYLCLPRTERFLGSNNFSAITRKVPGKLEWVGKGTKNPIWKDLHKLRHHRANRCNTFMVTCDQTVIGRTLWGWTKQLNSRLDFQTLHLQRPLCERLMKEFPTKVSIMRMVSPYRAVLHDDSTGPSVF